MNRSNEDQQRAVPRGSVAGIILAAGESARMGRDKALLQVGERTFLAHLVEVLQGEVAPIIVVVGAHAERIRRDAGKLVGCRIVENADYRRGQLSSLQAGLRALGSREGTGAVVVCLVDHPAIRKELVRRLIWVWRERGASVVIPTFRGRRGHPVLFSASVFAELLRAPLEEGARFVVRQHESELACVEVEDEGILWDVDTPEDYEKLRVHWGEFSGVKRGPGEAAR